jgi:predicted nucleotidyltransferase
MDANEQRRAIARRVVAQGLRHGSLRGVLLAGSAGRGDADDWSDVDLILYVDELPPPGTLDAIRESVGGVNPRARGARTDENDGVEFTVDEVIVEVLYTTVGSVEKRLEKLLVACDGLDAPSSQKNVIGLLEGLALYDDGVIEGWRRDLRRFPEPLRQALIELYWGDLYPVWRAADRLAARDAELWRAELVLDGAFRVLGILAALNRLYFSRVALKRMRRLTSAMTLAPAGLAERLEALPRLPAGEAADELQRLVTETYELVRQELPDLELRTARGARSSATASSRD